MNRCNHPTPELTGLLRHIVQHCMVDMGSGARVLDEVVTQALTGWTSDRRRWSGWIAQLQRPFRRASCGAA